MRIVALQLFSLSVEEKMTDMHNADPVEIVEFVDVGKYSARMLEKKFV